MIPIRILLLSSLRLERCTELRRCCYETGLAFVEVPSDGNCLIWSLRTLFMGLEHCRSHSKKDAKKDQSLFRTLLKNLWIDRKDSPLWQVIWEALCSELMQKPEEKDKADKPKVKKELGTEEKLCTPPKAARHEPELSGERKLSTPPRVEKANKRKLIQTGKNHAAPGFGPKEAEKQLKAPRPAGQNLLEPAIPDLRNMTTEAFEKAMNSKKSSQKTELKKPKPHEKHLEPKEEQEEDQPLNGTVVLMEDDDDQDDLDMAEWDSGRKRRRTAKFTRTCQKKLPSTSQHKSAALSNWLARKGLTYQIFVLKHRKIATMKRTWICHNDGFVIFKKKLLDGTIFEGRCKGCSLALEECEITVESMQNFETDFSGEAAITDHKEEKHQPEQTDEKSKKRRKRRQQAEEEILLEYKKCVEYVKDQGGSEVEFEETSPPPSVLHYKCKVCRTKGHPDGKINYLGPPKLNSVQFYLKQHLECPTHVRNRNRMKLIDGQEGKDPCEDRCPGYWVSDKNPFATGTLYHYETEFQLWCTNAKVDGEMTRHHYYSDLAQGRWYCRHRNCSGKVSQKQQACTACQSLGECGSVQRHVLRFATKWYAGILLNKRLFQPAESASEFLEKLQNSAFGARCSLWSSVVALDNAELQQWVRKSFAKNGDATDNLVRSVDSIVSPTLRVHVGSIDCRMKTLFTQFASAIDTNQLDAPQIVDFIVCFFTFDFFLTI